MTNSLTNYSKTDLASSKEKFKAYIDLHLKINPNLTETDIVMIRECISDDDITVAELEYAIKQAYKDPDRYGKVEWNHVWKWVQNKRTGNMDEQYPVFDGGTW